jgi:hypothetical protein
MTGIKKFSFSQLEEATNGFSHVLGRGGFGIVYKVVYIPYTGFANFILGYSDDHFVIIGLICYSGQSRKIR